MEYIGVAEEFTAERVIEKSRFVAYIGRSAGEEQAKAFLAGIRARHPLATHVCYGYIADAAGNLQRFSDDGEPHGTAGLPILGVIKAHALRETSIAVVRYFGGVKLGAGGLTRAYAALASDAVSAARLVRFESCVELNVRVSYADVNAALHFFEENGLHVLRRDFAADACFTVAVRQREADACATEIVGALSGRVTLSEGKRYLHPFPL